MEKNRICKICNRRFANGKAMGGHMRSHLAKLPLPPKPSSLSPHHSPSLSSSSSLNYPFTSPNPTQSYRSLNRDLTYTPKSNLPPEESETESPRSTTRRRSKRRRKIVHKVEDSPEQLSSVSDVFNEEDVALCLLMLSRDNKKTKKRLYDEFTEEIEIEGEDEVDDEDETFGEIRVRSKSNGKFKCETCKKRFRSYQALGGHRASHNNIKKLGDEYGAGVFVDRRVFKCPFCEKVFESGQALGGHKKVHFSYLGNAKSKSDDNLLDLNLPAPEHDDNAEEEDDELSQVYQHRN